jgi:hypothetical protein
MLETEEDGGDQQLLTAKQFRRISGRNQWRARGVSNYV